MKSTILTLFLFISLFVYSQEKSSELFVKHGFCKLDYFYLANSSEVVNDEVDSIVGVKSCIGYEELMKARRLCNIQKTMVTTGTVLIVMPILSYMITPKNNRVERLDVLLSIMGGGAVLTLASIPLTRPMKKHANESVRIYNELINPTSSSTARYLQFGVVSTGAGVCMKF